MPASLIVGVEKQVSFAEILIATHDVLWRLLKCKSVPSLLWKHSEGSAFEKGYSAMTWSLDNTFPSTYVKYEGDDIEDSLVSLFSFYGFKRRLLLSCCAEARTAASNALTAALSIAAAEVLGSLIEDAAHHWISKDVYLPNELIEKLSLKTPAPDFKAGLDLMYKSQAIHHRYPLKS